MSDLVDPSAVGGPPTAHGSGFSTTWVAWGLSLYRRSGYRRSGGTGPFVQADRLGEGVVGVETHEGVAARLMVVRFGVVRPKADRFVTIVARAPNSESKNDQDTSA